MSVTYSGKIDLDIAFQAIVAQGGMVSGPVAASFAASIGLPNGSSDNQINAAHAKTETGIGASVTTVYDLVGGIANMDNSANLNFDEVVLVAIKNLSSTAANYLTVGPDATNGFGVVAANKGFWADASDRNVIPADGDSWTILYSKGGVPAAAGTTDELAVITQGGTSSNTWNILILGRDNP